MNRLTSEELREMREYTEAATAGPWEVDVAAVQAQHEVTLGDATFIAKARTDMPRLLDGYATLQDEVERLETSNSMNHRFFKEECEQKHALQAENDRLRDALQRIADYLPNIADRGEFHWQIGRSIARNALGIV